MLDSMKLYYGASGISRLSAFHALCMSRWAYDANGANDVYIRDTFGYTSAQRISVQGSNAPQCVTVRDRMGFQVCFAGTTTFSQWTAYVLQFGLSNIQGCTGRTFLPFETWAQTLADSVAGIVTQTAPLSFMGHSMGGAMAVLVAAKLLARGYLARSVYTFGCPRVGDAAFVDPFDMACVNVQNAGDPVPWTPPSIPVATSVVVTGRAHLPPLYRPGFDYLMPQSNAREWIAGGRAALTIAANPLATLSNATGIPHLIDTYIGEAWAVGTAVERGMAAEWRGVSTSRWGLSLAG